VNYEKQRFKIKAARLNFKIGKTEKKNQNQHAHAHNFIYFLHECFFVIFFNLQIGIPSPLANKFFF
jgi:hypothetical protein